MPEEVDYMPKGLSPTEAVLRRLGQKTIDLRLVAAYCGSAPIRPRVWSQHASARSRTRRGRWIPRGRWSVAPGTYPPLTARRQACAVSKPGQPPFPPCLFELAEAVS